MHATPLVTGTLLAILAALAFGVTTPFVQRLGAGVGPFGTAALLYLGAALGSVSWQGASRERGAGVRPAHLPRVLVVALAGAAVAPTLFAWGLQRVSATYGSLLLNCEAAFTLGLALAIGREHVGRRVALAAALMLAGGAVTVAGASAEGSIGIMGALAILAAVLFWALDNVLTRPLADLDPAAVVLWKAGCGAALTGLLGLALRQPGPSLGQAAGLVACGATGYGASLRWYLLAQRRIGAGRTGSVFALAPFIGATAAVALGDRPHVGRTLAAGALFVAGLALHLTERHAHRHVHDELVHVHAHTHDDGHHEHRHEVPPAGAHVHPHRHERRTHAHPHAPDTHHGHGH